jgi:hypothetical protein
MNLNIRLLSGKAGKNLNPLNGEKNVETESFSK